MSDQSTYRFTSQFPKQSVALGTVRTIIQEAGGKPGDYKYTADGKAYIVSGPSMGLSNLQRIANKYSVDVTPWDSAVAVDADPGTTYSVTISMSSDTITALQQEGYYLYGFKAVAGMNTGKPVIWFSTQTFAPSTEVSWEEQYAAYVSLQTDIENGVTIQASNTVPMNLGQIFNVTSPHATGSILPGGQPGSISIGNSTQTQLSCGIAQLSTVAPSTTPQVPTCVFPLYGEGEDVITPIEKVLLMFATEAKDMSTVIEQAFSFGVLIDLTNAPGNTRQVSYDINAGWDPVGVGWTQLVDLGADLVKLLIQASPAAVPADK